MIKKLLAILGIGAAAAMPRIDKEKSQRALVAAVSETPDRIFFGNGNRHGKHKGRNAGAFGRNPILKYGMMATVRG